MLYDILFIHKTYLISACVNVIFNYSSSLRRHMQSERHKQAIQTMVTTTTVIPSVLNFVKQRDSGRQEAGDSFITHSTTTAKRMAVCMAILHDGIGFEILNGSSNAPISIRQLLERGGNCALPYTELRSLIPDVQEMIRVKPQFLQMFS